jgi:hypothetical protein
MEVRMANSENEKDQKELRPLETSLSPLVFISHDGRDSEFAEAFSHLLRSVSSGMIKTFRSSDKHGKEGIPFGEEWYTWLMSMLQQTSDVVCLFTERSVDRPWILFEAGVAKGKIGTPVFGVALGIPLNKVNSGPFFLFQNSEDTEESLSKLVYQLAGRVPNLEPDKDIVLDSIKKFKEKEAEILKKTMGTEGKRGTKGKTDDPIARLVEDMKTLPSRVAERLQESGEGLARRRKFRRFHPMMFDEIIHMSQPGDPLPILMAASLFRDEAPWLYEIANETYQIAKSEDPVAIKQQLSRIQDLFHSKALFMLTEEFGMMDKESFFFVREFPQLLEMVLARSMERKKPVVKRRTPKAKAESSE